MAGVSEPSIDPKRTVVVLNIPSNVDEDDLEDELTIHFQKEKNGGGDVDEVALDGRVAFVTFDLPGVVTSVLNHPEHVINGSKIDVQSYESWLANKKKQEIDNQKDSGPEDAVKTIFVSNIKDSTTEDAITLFFESKKYSGGGELCEGEERYKRLSTTVARLTFVSSKDVQNVLEKASKAPLKLEGNELKVSTEFEPTHDRSILLAKNLKPETNKETFQNFVETNTNVEVFNVVFGKDGKAIVILKTEIDEECLHNIKSSNEDMKLGGSIISLELAPLTKAIKISNIPKGTTSDDIRFKFSNKKSGGGQVTDMLLDKKNGVANIYFEKSSVVSGLVKKEHLLNNVLLNVIPYYDDFEDLQEITTKITEFSAAYPIESPVMDYIFINQEIETKFDFKTMKYDKESSRFHFSKDFDDPKLAQEFDNKLKTFLDSFGKEDVRIAKNVYEKVKKAIEEKRDEFEADKIDFSFDSCHVTFIGKKADVQQQKKLAEAMIDKILEEAKFQTKELVIGDKNQLAFLNFIDYFKNVMVEFPDVTIHGMESSSGKLSLFGTAENIKDVQLKILQDLRKMTEIDVKMSVQQIDFLSRTKCQIVNDELKKDDVMLMLCTIKGAVGAHALQAKIMTLKECDNTEEKRLLHIVHTKTSDKCIKVDEETAKFLTKSNKLQEFQKKMYDKHQVLIDHELTDPCNIWIVCDKSEMDNAEKELTSLADEKKIGSNKFRPMDPIKVRFLREHCWGKIKEKENSCKGEGVAVQDSDSEFFDVKGTQEGRKDMIFFLEKLAGNVQSKDFSLTEPGMKKEISMESTATIISDIEKNYTCVIQRETQPEETDAEKTDAEMTDAEKTEEATVVVDGEAAAGGSASASTSPMNLPYHSMSFVNDKEVKMASGQRITIVVGDLAHEKVDVIVNTTNDKVDLTANPCGKALLKVAGKELSNECKKIGSLQAGQMASTGPAKLNCKRVYHVRSSSWDNGKGAPILRKLIKKCLDQVKKDKLTSIAIPAIGTGNLHFPRPEVAKIFFEEITSYFTAHPQSAIEDVRFVAYSGDQATVNAFLDAVQEIKSMILSPFKKTIPVPVPLPLPVRKKKEKAIPSSLPNVTTSEKPDGSLELSLGSKNLTVQIVRNDISKETTDLIMHVTNEEFSFQGGVGKALIKVGGDSIVQECKTLGKPALFSTQYTKAGNLSVSQIAHVIGPGQPTSTELKRCLDTFFDDVMKKNIAKISFSAIGAGAMGFSESESAQLIFDNLSRIAESKNPTLNLARIVIFEKAKFVNFKDASIAYFASGGATTSSPQSLPSPKTRFSMFRMKKFAKTTAGDEGISIKIYSDDRGKIEKAWEELKRKMSQNIKEKIMADDVIKKFTDRHIETLRNLERDHDVTIKADQSKGQVKIKGHISDISSIQDEIHNIMKKIVENETNVPDNWDSKLIEGLHVVNLSTGSEEYKKVETAFHATAPNQKIVRIERIQNAEIYSLYNVKRQAMMKKYGSNFTGKELMLFHGTSSENISKINAGGLNRSFAGQHATYFGRGVYFARDASYSCRTTYSPPDSQGLRYMYYAKVLVGEYTQGDPGMIVAPSKNTGNPNEKYESVVDNTATPSMYVMFQDYEYYTEYLITFT